MKLKHLSRPRYVYCFATLTLAITAAAFIFLCSKTSALTLTGNGSVGLTGTIASPPPTQGATITTPTNGQVFTKVPITVAGLCPGNLLLKLFINGIFSGSTVCSNGSYQISAGLFYDLNSLQVFDYDALNQPGPGSNIVNVTYQPANVGSAITLTSNYAELGADPGQTITWPITIAGGDPPYAISVDWGDGTQPELVSVPASGVFNITHAYAISGIYNIIIRATDQESDSAFLQLVGVGNGPSAQSTTTSGSKKSGGTTTTIVYKYQLILIWIILIIILILLPIAFWLGRRHERERIKSRIEHGKQAF